MSSIKKDEPVIITFRYMNRRWIYILQLFPTMQDAGDATIIEGLPGKQQHRLDFPKIGTMNKFPNIGQADDISVLFWSDSPITDLSASAP